MASESIHQKISQVQILLKYTFVVVPIAAGLDKFINLLVQWDQYLHPAVADSLPFSASAFMMVIGVVEIAAGIIVFKWTKIGATIVSIWLGLIALSLLFSGQYLDVAVRDIVMAISAYVLAELTHDQSE